MWVSFKANTSLNIYIFLNFTLIFFLFSYLALVGALASEADFVFIPEWPPERDWPETLCKKLKQVLKRHFKIFIRY